MLDHLTRIYTRSRLIIIDLLLLNICLAASFFLRFEGEWLNYFQTAYLLPLTLIGAVILYFSDLYNRLWQYASIGELMSIIKNAIIINLLFMTYTYFWQITLPRSIPVLNTLLLIFALGGFRFSLRLLKDYLEKREHSQPESNVLIVGAGDAGEMIIREMHKHPELDKRIVGLVDDDPEKQNLRLLGVRVLGTRGDIPQIIEQHGVDEVIIAIPSAPGSEVKEIFNLARGEDVSVETVPGMYELINGDVSLSQLREVQVEDLLRRDPVELDTGNICSYLEGRTVLVTGGGGSIGSELCRQIAEYEPKRLLVLDIYENSTYLLLRELQENFPDLEVVPIIASVRDEERLDYIFARHRPDVVFHAAAHKHVPLMEENPGEAVKNNIAGTWNTARMAEQYDSGRFVLISTDKAVNPTNVMGASKRVAEMLIQRLDESSKTSFMAVRFGNVLGSEGSVIPIFKEQIKNGGPLTVTHSDVRRYFMTIPEAVQLVLQAGSQGQGGEVFVLDMGEPVKIIDLARDLISLSGYTPGEDIEIEITGLRPGEKLFEELMSEDESNQATEHERIYVSTMEDNIPLDLFEEIRAMEKLIEQDRTSDIIVKLEDIVEGYEPERDNVREVVFSPAYRRQKQEREEGM